MRHKAAPTAQFLDFPTGPGVWCFQSPLDAKADCTVPPLPLDPNFVNVFQRWFQADRNFHRTSWSATRT